MEFKDFLTAINNLRAFFKEQEKLNNVLKVISPTSTGVCEFGNKFIDDYIKVLEIALGDEENWVSWFVFDNQFGEKKFQVKIKDKVYEIYNELMFYNVCIQLNSTLPLKVREF